VQDTQPGAFDQDTIAVLQTMADQVGVALDNARLFTESQLALEASRRAYGELSHQAWRELLHAHPEWGYTYAHDSIAPVEGDWCPEMLQAVQTSRSVQGRDREERTLAVPLKVRDDVIGVLSFEKGEADKVWTGEEIALMEILVDQLGQALESARLYHDTQRRAERERLTGEVTARMRETLDLETVLKTAVQEVRQAMGLREVVVRLVPEADTDTQAGNGSEQNVA
jgi:GAF domain-containing protein